MGIILFAISYYLSAFVLADDMLNQYQPINDSGALVSARGDFKLGFFSTNNSMSRYLGIWCNNIPVQTIVWVANRDRPLNDSSGGLKIGEDGNLILLGSGGIVAWSTSIQNLSSKPTAALLLDSGNLVLRSENGGNTESYIWQSFDHPSDTLIAGVISKGSVKQYRTGISNRLQFNGVEPQNSIFNANFIDNSEEVYFKFDLDEQITGLVLNYTGQCNV
ncbi:G-type lectin S-receptor-like serine/threonine-protein kinase At4g27290 [Camellia sinensis]|uniref:G-type lectin S-receptor-like serine/threonine-protein kinase At4g27290 n=1 Tax=Camellia sinensis TaxID=4442 RepID=UPI00103670CA|nr:G-type lectin S-receptor-like serine/threonine-protein kinase At4g27290 [Camellia sinensis]